MSVTTVGSGPWRSGTVYVNTMDGDTGMFISVLYRLFIDSPRGWPYHDTRMSLYLTGAHEVNLSYTYMGHYMSYLDTYQYTHHMANLTNIQSLCKLSLLYITK